MQAAFTIMERLTLILAERFIYVSYSKVIINHSYFNNNIANYDNGGAISAQYSNITVESSEFSHNFAYYDGGAIYMDNRDENFELRITDTILYGNRADYGSGGAICMYIHYNQNNGNVTNKLQMKNTMIYGNIADDKGRVVYIYNCTSEAPDTLQQHSQFTTWYCLVIPPNFSRVQSL